MPLGPIVHGGQHRLERLAPRRQRVFDLRRNLGIDLAVDEAVGLHFAKLLRERLVRDAGEEAVQLVEAFDPLEQLLKDQDFPAAADDRERGLDQATDRFLGHGTSSVSFRIPGNSKVHTSLWHYTSE